MHTAYRIPYIMQITSSSCQLSIPFRIVKLEQYTASQGRNETHVALTMFCVSQSSQISISLRYEGLYRRMSLNIFKCNYHAVHLYRRGKSLLCLRCPPHD